MGRAKAVWMEERERGWTSFHNKYVCAKCIEDDAIQKLIVDTAEEFECSYCGNSSTSGPIAADMNTVMEVIYFGIRQVWSDPNSVGVPYETAEGGWQGEVIDSWDLLREELNLGLLNEELFHDVHSSIVDHQWCKRHFWDLSPQQEWMFDWRRFAEAVKHKSRFGFLTARSDRQLRRILDVLARCFKRLKLVKTLPAGTVLVRSRRHKKHEKFDTCAQMGPPPKHKALAPNRMSPSGISMFYGAFDAKTAMAEVCSDPTDTRPVVTTAHFDVKKPMHVIDLTAIPPVPSLFDTEQADDREAIIFLHDFLKDFTAPVEKDGREHVEYVPTQVVTEYIRYQFRDQHDRRVHGVVYPSAVAPGKSCVLFIEGAETDASASLNPRSVDKWLDFDPASITTGKVK